MSFSLLQSIILFGGLQGIILAFILQLSRQYTNKAAVSYLSLFVGVFSLLMIRNIAETTILSDQWPLLFTLSSALVPLLGPSLYLFVVRIINQQRQTISNEISHFLPAILYALFLLGASFAFDIVDRVQLSNYPRLQVFVSVLQIAILLLLLSYLIAAAVLLYRANQRIDDHYSVKEANELKFVLILLVVITVIAILWVLFFSADIELLRQARSQQALELFWLFISVSIFVLSYYCLLHPKLFTLTLPKVRNVHIEKDNQQLDSQQQALLALMEQERPYLDPQLNLQQLANKLSMKPKELTYVINHGLNKTFYELINHYRIEQVKNRLQHPQSIEEKLEIIAYESGIKSSSTFNRLFKQYVNMSPKEYRQQVLTLNNQ